MRAKFTCDSITEYQYGKEVDLSAVQSSDNLEDQDFNVATPSGNLKMHIDNEKAAEFFTPGKSYYIDFTEA